MNTTNLELAIDRLAQAMHESNVLLVELLDEVRAKNSDPPPLTDKATKAEPTEQKPMVLLQMLREDWEYYGPSMLEGLHLGPRPPVVVTASKD